MFLKSLSLLLMAAFVLCGCLGAQVVSSTPRQIILRNDSSFIGNAAARAAGQKLAEAECQKYGRHAVMKAGFKDYVETYECVE